MQETALSKRPFVSSAWWTNPLLCYSFRIFSHPDDSGLLRFRIPIAAAVRGCLFWARFEGNEAEGRTKIHEKKANKLQAPGELVHYRMSTTAAVSLKGERCVRIDRPLCLDIRKHESYNRSSTPIRL
ncbi:hypothetical protein SRHO_G00038410 [Serrasalmus rhombeus]